jgi:AcrR family transcriptional regulator
MRLLAHGVSPAALSLRAVAREARITAPAIYPHFAGMDELLSAVVTRRFADFSDLLMDAVESLPGRHTPRDELLARCLAYCRFGLERRSDYELLFGRGEAHGGIAYENSAGQSAFSDLVNSVAEVRTDADSTAIAAVLWPALHGLVYARLELTDFPWPPLIDQVERLIDGLVVNPCS